MAKTSNLYARIEPDVKVLEPVEISHSEPGDNRQFWPDENRQLLFS